MKTFLKYGIADCQASDYGPSMLVESMIENNQNGERATW